MCGRWGVRPVRPAHATGSRAPWAGVLPALLSGVRVDGSAAPMARTRAVTASACRRANPATSSGAIAALAFSTTLLLAGGGNVIALVVALIVFFSAFNILEASLPSLVSKAAPAKAKGTALGVYSSLQFLGIFAGGAAGGWANQRWGEGGVLALTIGLGLLWLLAALSLRPARH